jgi:predicted dehydrogenase
MTSRTRSKAEELAKMFDIDHVYETADLLLDGCSPDGIMVLVSANQIYNVAINLLPTGIPLFLEKPPGLVPEQTKSLADLADKYRTKNMVGFNRRYYSIFHKGLEIINQNGGLLGLAVEGHERFWKISGTDMSKEIHQNWIYGNSTHTLDLLRFFGGEIIDIYPFSKSLKEKNVLILVLAWNFYNEIKKNNLILSNNFINIKDLEK